MYKMIISLLLTLFLSSCSLFHIQKQEVVQGNIVTPELVSQLHKGMSDGEVRQVMGNPVIFNILTPDRMEYVYTYQLGSTPRIERRVTLIFDRGKVVSIIDN